MNKKIDKKELRTSLVIFLVLISFIFLLEIRIAFSADENLTVDTGSLMPYVDAKILEAFDNNASEVIVLVNIHSRNPAKVDEILSTLPSAEFRLKKKLQSGRGFSGNITAKGLGHLINNSDIKSIYLNEPLHVVSGNEEQEEREFDIIENYSMLVEEEQKLVPPRNVRELEEIKKAKEKNPLLLITGAAFALLIAAYLFIKFKSKIQWEK